MGNIYETYIGKDKSNFWVAELEGQVIGCVGALPDPKNNDSCELIRMSVDSDIRRRGVGSLLIK